EQQTATSEILRVISSSPADVQPVFESILASSVRLCGAIGGAVLRLDGEQVRVGAFSSSQLSAEADRWYRTRYPRPLGRQTPADRAMVDRTIVHIPDTEAEPSEQQRGVSRAFGFRSLLVVPMLKADSALGAIAVYKAAPGPFASAEIDLLTTFADQAVIAIENVRLFNETKEALEQQTATSEVLRAISRAHTDAQPVFDIIAASALQLCGAVFSAMVLYDGKILRLVAIQNAQTEVVEALRKVLPRPLDEESAASRAIRSRAVVNIPDVFHDPHFAYGNVARAANYRSVLAVPMLRDGEPVGVILATRPEAGPFSGK